MNENRFLKDLLKKRLDDAVEDIFEIFERTVAEYEEQIRRQRRTLESVLSPSVSLQRPDTDVSLEPEAALSLKEEPEESATYSPPKAEPESAPYSPEKREPESAPYSPPRAEPESAPYSPDFSPDFSDPTGVIVKTEVSDSEQTDHSSEADPEADPDPEAEPDQDQDQDQDEAESPEPDQSSDPDHGEPGSFSCTVCRQTFDTRTLLTDHLTSHLDKKKCQICGTVVGPKSLIRRHMMTHSGEKPFSCCICDRRFTRNFHLQKHLRTCKPENILIASTPDVLGTFICSVCGEISAKNSELTQHMMTHTSGTPPRCMVCDKVVGSVKSEVRRHMLVHSGEKPFSCKICGKRFVRKFTLRTHLKSCNDANAETENMPEVIGAVGTFSCSFCNEPCSSECQLTDHMTEHTDPETGKCQVCDKAISRTKNDVRRHMMIHSGEKPFSCSICGKRFNRNSTLQVHLNICNEDPKPESEQTPEEEEEEEDEEGEFSCTFCNQPFSRTSQLTDHMTTHVSDPPGTCLICLKSTGPKLYDVRRHMMSHTGERPFSCKCCGKRFTRRFTLRMHLKMCSKEAPVTEPKVKEEPEEVEEEMEQEVSCSLCKESFASEIFLTGHMMTHFDETTRKCLVCNETLKQGELRRHMRIHSGEKTVKKPRKKPGPDDDDDDDHKHICSICDQSFKTMTNLKYHMLIHSGVKPFSCTVCGKKFRHKFDKTRHMMTHTGEKPFQCRFCDKGFTRRTVLQMHMKTHGRQLTEMILDEEEMSVDNNDSGGQPIICNECGRGFNKDLPYRRHLQTCGQTTSDRADQGLTYSCSICSETFPDKRTLAEHLSTHTSGAYVDCSICGKTCLRQTLRDHLSVHLGDREYKEHVCEICGKKFNRSRDLKTHVNQHAKEKEENLPFGCSICGKRYAKNSSLKSHITERHRNPGAFRCHVCGKLTRRKGDLNRHMLTHIEEKPLKCQVCGKGFIRKNQLSAHMKTHTEEEIRTGVVQVQQNYTCPVCAFPCESYIHQDTRERQFDCPSCQKIFLVKD